jgi:hypothetical protein
VQWGYDGAGANKQQVAAAYNKRADDANRKRREDKYLKKVFTDLAKSVKPTGDLNRSPNVTRAKEIERAIHESVEMAIWDDDEVEGSDSDEEDEESDSEHEAPAKPTTVERLRPPRAQITKQVSQRDKIMGAVSSALEKKNSTDLGSTFEKVAVVQML